MKNREKFVTALTDKFEELFNNPQYASAVAALNSTPDEMAEKLTQGLIDGATDKGNVAIIHTCRVLKIEHTYRVIKAYLEKQ